ncbi:MAG: response regulator [Oleiphilaceae bacterium]|nr:response regulator [Oleiphilaceae bacterium]
MIESVNATVLLVDDNAQNLQVLYETLKDRGYKLLVANDGDKALTLAERHLPEVILLDIMMPGLDGYEVCRRLKSSARTADTAVIFLSALDDVDAKVKGFGLGGADYIAKPFQPQEVVARVHTHAQVILLERELQARNQKLENDQSRILNAISEGIYGLDPKGRIVFANPAAAMITGSTPNELTGRNFFELHFAAAPPVGDEDLTTASLPVQATCSQGVAEHRRNIAMLRRDGSSFLAEYRATPKLENDQLAGAVVVFRDITSELDNDRALENARETVQQQRDQLAHASRMATMGEMAAGFAHEINQPLTAITNYARVTLRMLAEDQTDQDLIRQTLGKIEAQSHRASEIIRRIRTFVKKPAAGKEVLSVRSLLEETRQFAEVDAKNNEVDIQVTVEEDVPDVLADPVQVQQVALNLIRNALESTRSLGRDLPVLVHAERQSADCVKITVTDQGEGVPEEAEDRLFLPFYTTKESGMGIGLALCRSLIQAQGGDIRFERPEGGGACFAFTLPAAPAA